MQGCSQHQEPGNQLHGLVTHFYSAQKIHKARCIESFQKETYGKEKNNTSTAVILTDYNGGGGVGDNGDGRASLTN